MLRQLINKATAITVLGISIMTGSMVRVNALPYYPIDKSYNSFPVVNVDVTRLVTYEGHKEVGRLTCGQTVTTLNTSVIGTFDGMYEFHYWTCAANDSEKAWLLNHIADGATSKIVHLPEGYLGDERGIVTIPRIIKLKDDILKYHNTWTLDNQVPHPELPTRHSDM